MNDVQEYKSGHPIKRTIEAIRGDTFRPDPIIGYNGDGSPYDFTGHSFRMQVRKSENGELLLTVPNESFTITQDDEGIAAGVNNKVDPVHTKDDMDFETGTWVYDIEMTDASGNVDTIYKEKFILKPDVSE